MWPFKKEKSAAEIAVEWTPQAIDVARQKWLEFVEQPFTNDMALDEMLFLFTEGLSHGLRQWEAFKRSPDAFFMLIAAKGVERSRTHLRIEIETALKIPLPLPHERTDEEESRILLERLVDRASRKWAYYINNLAFKDTVTLKWKIESFKVPFLQGVRNDFPMFRDADDQFFDGPIALGIAGCGEFSLDELEQALEL